MTMRGTIVGGVVVLETESSFPDGSEVVVQLVEQPIRQDAELSAVLLRHAGRGTNLPADLAENHDHYAHGKPRS